MVDIINRVTVQGVSQGLDKVAADLHGVAAAQGDVASASAATATITDSTSRKALSAAAAYDRLRRSLDPVYLAQQKLAGVERVLSRASDQGLVDLAQRNELLALAAQRYQAITPAIAGGSAALVRLGSSVRNVQNDTRQLSFQLFDLAQGIPLIFVSPLYGILNFGTQIGQISQLFIGRGGLKQAFADTIDIAKGFGAGLVSGIKGLASLLISGLSSPLGLITLGFVALGVAAATAIGIIISKLPTAERAMKQHEDSIKRIEKAWKDAQKGPAEYQRHALSEIQFQANIDRVAQKELLQQQLQGALGMGAFTGQGLAAQLREELLKIQVSIQWTAQQRAMQDYAGAIKEFLDSVDKGNPDLEKFNATIAEIANKHAGQKAYLDAAQALREYASEATLTKQRLKDLEESIPLRLTPGPMMPAMPPKPDSNSILLEVLKQKTQMKRIQDGLSADLTAISAKSPKELGINASLQKEIDLREQDIGSIERQTEIDNARTRAVARAEFAISEAERHRKVARDAAVESAQLETSLVGKSIGEQTRLRAQLQMTQEAKQAAADAGVIVSDAEIAQINAAAAALGKLVEQQHLMSLRSDLKFDRSQMFRSPIEQDVADQLRSIYGDDFLAHMHDFEAEQIRINARLKELNDIGNDVTHDLVSGLFEGIEKGQSAFEALASAGESALQRIQSKLEDVLADRLWSMLFNALGSSFGGAVGGVPVGNGSIILHQGGVVGEGGGVMRYVHPAYFDDAPRMHRGGLAGDEVPAILQRGERVLPRGASGGGVHVTINNNAGVKVQTQDNGVDANGVRQLGVAIDAMVGEAIKKRSRPQMMRR